MKYLFTYVFLCFIFGSVLTENIPRYKLARLGLALRKLKLHKEEMRKLQSTDEDTEEPVPIPESYNSTGGGKEEGNANQQDAEIPADTPVSTQGTETDKKSAEIQILKFHNFDIRRGNKINFGVFFFFYNKPLPYYIIIRIRVTYYRRLRTLDGEADTADSLRTVCTLNATNLTNRTYSEGKTVDYICEATASKEIEKDKINIALNTDVDMVTVIDGKEEVVGFSEVNFNANTSAEASNLQENTISINENNVAINYLRNGYVDNSEKHLLRIIGTNKNDLGENITNGEKLTMILQTSNRSGGIRPEEYECTVNITNDNSSLTMDCDTSSKSINISNKYLHLSVSKETYQILTLQMADYDNTDAIIRTASSNGIRYRKNSGGLSGGAIAGIVIACVVVLAAASIAAIMLRRPKSNTDNTTVVGLKTVDNL